MYDMDMDAKQLVEGILKIISVPWCDYSSSHTSQNELQAFRDAFEVVSRDHGELVEEIDQLDMVLKQIGTCCSEEEWINRKPGWKEELIKLDLIVIRKSLKEDFQNVLGLNETEEYKSVSQKIKEKYEEMKDKHKVDNFKHTLENLRNPYDSIDPSYRNAAQIFIPMVFGCLFVVLPVLNDVLPFAWWVCISITVVVQKNLGSTIKKL